MSAQVEVPIGSIWRENDSRFERYVKVLGLHTKNGEPAALIAGCSPNGLYVSSRWTDALLRRFGKSYKLFKAP